MMYIIFICFMIVLCSAKGKEGKENQEEIFKKFCADLDLDVDLHADPEKCTLAVYFEVLNSIHNACFKFYDVYLKNVEEEEVKFFRVEFKKGHAFHRFENVTSGVYNISIKSYCPFKKCPPDVEVHYNPFFDRMTNSTCISSNRNKAYRTSVISETSTTSVISETSTTSVISETPTTSVTKKIYPISLTKETYTSLPNDTNTALADKIYESEYQNSLKERRILIIVMTCILLVIIGILIHLARRKKRQSLNRIPITSNHKNNNNYVVQNTGIEVYILYYYDRKGEMKKKVEVIKDFLLKLSYFSCVKGIEDELAVILFNVNNWLNDVLDKSGKDGTVKRVILITSQEENEPDDDEIENQIYSAILKKINNTDEQCFTCNNNIHFVQLDKCIVHTVRFGNIIWQHQYSLCGDSTLDHMMDLCLNLCSGLKLETHLVKKKVRELFMNHPVRHFGNSLKFVECV